MKFITAFTLLAVCSPVTAHAQTVATSGVAASGALPMAPKSAATSDAFVWRFAPPVGSRWTMRLFDRSTWLLETPATEGIKRISITFTTIRKFTADYDVLSRDALGATTIRLTLREMTNDVTSVSDGKPDKKSASDVTDPKAVAGATLTVKQAPNGAFWGVVGARTFQRKMLEVGGLSDKKFIDSMADTSQPEVTRVVKSLSMMLGTLPVSPVRLGESWDYPVPAASELGLDINGTRTLKKLDSEIAVISDSVNFTGDNSRQKVPATPGVSNLSKDYIQASVSTSGTSRVQRSSGLPMESTVNQTIIGNVSTQIPAANGVAAQNLKVPLNMTSSVRVVLEPRE